MASLVRVAFARVVQSVPKCPNGLTLQVRTISGKTMRVKTPAPKPKPWDYKNKPYRTYHYFVDKTTARLDENSKIIVVEGPVAAGKSKFAQELADELEMAYFPEANQDMWYINDYGFDMRSLDDQLPDSCKSFDINNFLINPKHRLTANFQLLQYAVKYSQYIDALAHVLSTGQGVILDRCVYSDFVFLEAMYSQGYISRGARSVYYDIRKNSINELMRPHLVIYLDVPVPRVLENIKKRNLTYEVNSPALNPQYLAAMEKNYKQKYLKEISHKSELLVYDWSNEGEVEVIVEDIERMHFGFRDEQDPKFDDWRMYQEELWAMQRRKYSDKKDWLMTYLYVPRYDVPELVIDAEDAKLAQDIQDEAPGNEYAVGFNKSMGDSGILFKGRIPHRDTLPLRERRTFT